MAESKSTISSFKAGMYLLETLTSGMYNEPLSIYREYIQNAVDSIDIAKRKSNKTTMKVNIELDPFEKCIKISDNGFGIPIKYANQVLSTIGNSNKSDIGLRGFRGIGRLGGIAFSDKAIFRTKANGEKVESIQEWDCKKLRKYLSESKRSNMTIDQIFNRITNFCQKNSKRKANSYFEVTLEGVSSFRNYIFDINKVRNYLSQIAPLPFNPKEFSYAKEIGNYLSEKLSNYSVYEIILNGESVYKSYKDVIKTTNKGYDIIDGITPINIAVNDKPVAHGWYGKRRDLLGAIAKGENSSGIRVRVGNILIGDSHLLDGCFREARFNSYVIGEIHIDCPELIPNSRRDDFVDNDTKTLFFNAIEKEVGLPISKKIRLKSQISSKNKALSSKTKNQELKTIQKTSSKSEINILKDNSLNNISTDISAKKIIMELNKMCRGCKKLSIISSNLHKN